MTELLTMLWQGAALCAVIGGIAGGLMWVVFRYADWQEGRRK